MGKLFDLESPLFSGLNKMADLPEFTDICLLHSDYHHRGVHDSFELRGFKDGKK